MNSNDQVLFVLNVINSILQFLSLVFLIVYVVKTWEMAAATRRSAEATERSVTEMREARDQESAPYVVVYFDIPVGSHMIYLVIKNIGKSVATNIRFTITPPLQTTIDWPIHDLAIFRDGIASMPPGYEIRTIVDGSVAYFGRDDFPLKYEATANYHGGIGSNPRQTVQILDLSARKGLMFASEKTITDVADELGDIAGETKAIRQSLEAGVRSLNTGIRISNPAISIVRLDSQFSEWGALTCAKLREIMTSWEVEFGELRDHGTGVERMQNSMAQYAGQLLILLSNAPSGLSEEVRDGLSDLSTSLVMLRRRHLYADGGTSLQQLISDGDAALVSARILLSALDSWSSPQVASNESDLAQNQPGN